MEIEIRNERWFEKWAEIEREKRFAPLREKLRCVGEGDHKKI
jgi:hypothetical protein